MSLSYAICFEIPGKLKRRLNCIHDWFATYLKSDGLLLPLIQHTTREIGKLSLNYSKRNNRYEGYIKENKPDNLTKYGQGIIHALRWTETREPGALGARASQDFAMNKEVSYSCRENAPVFVRKKLPSKCRALPSLSCFLRPWSCSKWTKHVWRGSWNFLLQLHQGMDGYILDMWWIKC